MRSGSFATATLNDLSIADIDAMLKLDETLFIEHKSGIGQPKNCFKLRQAMASFANTAGGWLLLGVRDGEILTDLTAVWAQDGVKPLVDLVRDRVRGRIDPLPAFECRVVDEYPGGPIGVIRVYESSDTPHVLEEGLIFVREPAGVRKLGTATLGIDGPETVRSYAAVELKSRSELIELTQRGQAADDRMRRLMAASPDLPLIRMTGLVPLPDGLASVPDQGLIVARLAPYSASSRFSRWAASREAAGAVLRAAEDLADMHGLQPGWVTPNPAGAAVISVPLTNSPHADRFHHLDANARVAVDGAGLAAAAIWLQAPGAEHLRARRKPEDMARTMIQPVIRAAAAVLEAGEFVGRCRCNIDLIGLPQVILLEGQGDHTPGDVWVQQEIDLMLRAEPDDLERAARVGAFAYARSAGLPYYTDS